MNLTETLISNAGAVVAGGWVAPLVASLPLAWSAYRKGAATLRQVWTQVLYVALWGVGLAAMYFAPLLIGVPTSPRALQVALVSSAALTCLFLLLVSRESRGGEGQGEVAR